MGTIRVGRGEVALLKLPNRCFSPLHPYRRGPGAEPDIRAQFLRCMSRSDAIPWRYRGGKTLLAQITELLGRMQAGDSGARDALFAAAYAELHRLARARLRQGARDVVLDTTCLVHESYLRFVSAGELRAEDRRRRNGGRVLRDPPAPRSARGCRCWWNTGSCRQPDARRATGNSRTGPP